MTATGVSGSPLLPVGNESHRRSLQFHHSNEQPWKTWTMAKESHNASNTITTIEENHLEEHHLMYRLGNSIQECTSLPSMPWNWLNKRRNNHKHNNKRTTINRLSIEDKPQNNKEVKTIFLQQYTTFVSPDAQQADDRSVLEDTHIILWYIKLCNNITQF